MAARPVLKNERKDWGMFIALPILLSAVRAALLLQRQ